MNSTEHLDHVAETNNSLLFPSVFRQAWATFKQKWGVLYTLSLIPVIFVVAACAIFISTIYIVMKLAGDTNMILTVASIVHYAPHYISAIGSICAIVTIIGAIYFTLRSTISAVKVLESDSKMSVRHAWHGVSFKNTTSLLAALILFGIIIAGGYFLLFVPVLFLITFYSNVVFVNIIDGKKGIDALVVSRQYVKGYGAIVFVNLLVVVGVGLLFGLLFRLILGGASLLLLAVYFGKLSIVAAIVLALLVVIVGILILVLWKAFSLVVVYAMYKKLKALKAHHPVDLNKGRKTVKVWLILSIIAIAIFVGVVAALSEGNRAQGPLGPEEAMMRYQGNSNFTDSGMDYGQQDPCVGGGTDC